MKRKPYTLVWVVCTIAAAMFLTACVRPVPTEPVATLIPTSESDPSAGGDIPTQVPVLPPTSTPLPEVPNPDGSEGTEDTTNPTPTPTPATTENQVYVVKSGDSINKIAQQFGVTPEELAQANNISTTDTIHPGQELTLPGETAVVENPPATATPAPEQGTGGPNEQPYPGPPGNSGVHVVQRGENLFRIGLKYGCTVNQMAQFNGIRNPNYIYPGQSLKIPPRC